MQKVAVMGASGFAGAELIRRILMHPQLELIRVAAIDHVGELVSAAHPHLEGMTDLRFENVTKADLAAGADVVMLGLPHKVSFEVVGALIDENVKILDLSGAFRLRRPEAYERFYGGPHPHPEWLDRFVYGLPELNRAKIRGAQHLASPGCFATTLQLGLLPLARAGLLKGQVDSVAITGSSGSGVNPTATTHHPVRAGNLRTYKPLSHAHEPEVEDGLRSSAAGAAADLRVLFVPVSAPLVRGIFATSYVRVDADADPDSIRQAFLECFAADPFVRCPTSRLPEVVAVASSNYAEVGVHVGPVEKTADGRHERVLTCFSALDNLVKGGAGQAIQNLNLMLELDETTALADPGGYP